MAMLLLQLSQCSDGHRRAAVWRCWRNGGVILLTMVKLRRCSNSAEIEQAAYQENKDCVDTTCANILSQLQLTAGGDGDAAVLVAVLLPVRCLAVLQVPTLLMRYYITKV